MFELNDNLEVKKELFEGTVIYTIDNFYKNPKEVENYLFGKPNEIPLHKIHEMSNHHAMLAQTPCRWSSWWSRRTSWSPCAGGMGGTGSRLCRQRRLPGRSWSRGPPAPWRSS